MLLNAEIDRLLQLGVIEESEESSPVVLVQKPGKVGLRNEVSVYLDDLPVISNNFENH